MSWLTAWKPLEIENQWRLKTTGLDRVILQVQVEISWKSSYKEPDKLDPAETRTCYILFTKKL